MANAFFRLGRRSALGIRSIVRRVARGFGAVAGWIGELWRALRSDGSRRIGIVTIASSLVGAFALPAFADGPTFTDNTHSGQSVVAAEGATAVISKDNFSALSAAQAARQGISIVYPSYHGPSVSDFLKNPSYPSYDLAAVFAVAKQYTGVPYRYGGASPAGFDCSGYVQFVYSQFGISLPHSVSGQAARGTPIGIADAQPGDLVIMPGHNGFYAGNGMILDAPRAGGVVAIRPIWTSTYYIVRLGI